jgi:hypothetical protein
MALPRRKRESAKARERAAKERALQQRATDVAQRVRLCLLMGYDVGAAQYLLEELRSDTDPSHLTCQQAIAVYTLDRFQAAKQVLCRELQRTPLDYAVCNKYAMQLTELGILAITGTGYAVVTDGVTQLDEHVAKSIHHLRAGRLIEARQEAEKAERRRTGKGKSLRTRVATSSGLDE